ncbi:ABC transporter permease [Streptococcus suis]|nr:ABC transporter permease [Streptococcus suis]
MDKLMQQRRLDFNRQCAKYLRYVFNDHFVLVVMFLIGFLVVQYTQLIRDFPRQSHWPIVVVLLFSVSMTFWGKVATYMEPADQVFLLPQEQFWQDNLKKAMRKTFFLWGSLQLVLTVLLAPVFLLSGWALWQFIIWLMTLLILRALRLNYHYKQFYQGNLLNFERLITYEQERQQGLLTFFSLFTNVKGISVKTKPRTYLNPLLRWLIKTDEKRVWLELFARAYLRHGDYFWLSVRLLLISLGLGISLPNGWGVLMVGLVNYLLLFQLFGLFHVYDYQVMTRLFPVTNRAKASDFKTLLTRIVIGLTAIQMVLVLWHWYFLMLIPFMITLLKGYMPNKLKKLVD